MPKDIQQQAQQSMLANKMARYGQAIRDLRLYFHGVVSAGGEADLPVQEQLLKDALQEAEALFLNLRNKALKESGLFDLRADSSDADITQLKASA